MALAFNRNEIEMESKSQATTVADNDIAKLMYYLNSACYTIGCNNDPEIRRFTNWSNWNSLSIDEQQQLFVICNACSPDIFINNKVFFQSDALCMNRSNEFYEISQVSNQLVASESIIIAGQIKKVNKIMTYKMCWMQQYYFEPMHRQAQRFRQSKRGSSCLIS